MQKMFLCNKCISKKQQAIEKVLVHSRDMNCEACGRKTLCFQVIFKKLAKEDATKKPKAVSLITIQETFERLPSRRLERMKCPGKGKRKCPQLARMQRGGCTPENCVLLQKKLERHREKRAGRALELATGKRVAEKDSMLHPKNIPMRDQRILRELSPGFDHRTRFRPKVLKKQLEKNGVKMQRLKKSKLKKFNKAVIMLVSKRVKTSSAKVLETEWKQFLQLIHASDWEIVMLKLYKNKGEIKR